MRMLLVCSSIICLVAGPAFAGPPFAPRSDQPDYVVTMIWSSHGRQTGSRIVTHHGAWTRVDQDKSTGYFSANGIANIRVYGEPGSVFFERGRLLRSDLDNEPRNTAERQTHLGETCTVWDVWRTRPDRAGYGISSLSCLTDDGIELWHKLIDGKGSVTSSVEATRLERRPVAPEAVEPPRKLLQLNWWDENLPAPGAQAIADHETVMELSGAAAGAGKSIRTTRRLGPWQFLEERVGDTRHHVEIKHDSRRMWLTYHDDNFWKSPKQLNIIRTEPAPTGDPPPAQANAMQPKTLNYSETVLGETCRWFDMMPGMADAGRWACLTKDGIVLKDNVSGRGDARSWTAVRLTRRKVTLDEIKPPAELVDPRLWGLE